MTQDGSASAQREALRSMSGLDFMRAMLAGEVAAPSMAAHLNYRLHAVEPGRVTFRGTPLAHVCNPYGAVHGGWYGALLDSAMGCAVMTAVPRGRHYTTLEYKVNVVRPVPLGHEVEAVGVLQHPGRRTGVAAAELRDAEGRLYATGSTTCIILPADG